MRSRRALKAGIGRLQAILVLQLSAVVVIEVVVTSDNLLETRKMDTAVSPSEVMSLDSVCADQLQLVTA